MREKFSQQGDVTVPVWATVPAPPPAPTPAPDPRLVQAATLALQLDGLMQAWAIDNNIGSTHG